MIVESTTRTASRWPINTSRPAPASWNQPTRPIQQARQQPRDWWAYGMLAGTTVLIGCLATLVVVLAR
ncbi:hypothetical protein ACGFI9_22615 [Micromonospora sp. NPDC048930]|uniref:hypothetical protein n=1 Tax=Micromonospora sp. NPDC048930 TaxID=3364261 RepID=UPI003723F9BB